MKNWLLQTTTLAGLVTLPITGIQAYQSGGDALTVALAVLNGLLFLINDGKFLAGLAVLLFVGASAQACKSIPVPKAAQVAAATAVGCAVIDASGCYDELQQAFPVLGKTTCHDVVETALKAAENAKEIWEKNSTIYGKELNKMLSAIPEGTIDLGYWDPLAVDAAKIAKMKNGKCAKLADSLGVK